MSISNFDVKNRYDNSIWNMFHKVFGFQPTIQMVYFVCNKCQETIRKCKVEEHSSRCRSDSYSCVDCGKDFSLSEACNHNTCITEEEKYQGKLYNASKVQLFATYDEQKKDNPQLEWMKLLDEAVANNRDPSLKPAFDKLLTMDNVPRKKAKFVNFVKNCCYIQGNLIERVWSVLEEVKNKQTAERIKREEAVREQV